MKYIKKIINQDWKKEFKKVVQIKCIDLSEKCTFQTSQRKLLRLCKVFQLIKCAQQFPFNSAHADKYCVHVQEECYSVLLYSPYNRKNTIVGPALAKISYTSFGLASIISHFHLIVRIHAQLGGKQTGGPLADIHMYIHIDQPEIIERVLYI